LLEKLDAWGPKTVDRVNLLTQAMIARGATPDVAHARALGILDGGVSQQALVMSFGDTFWATAALIVVTLPLVLLLGKGGSKVEMGH
jgi:DHA2 family multidrug resistance protein